MNILTSRPEVTAVLFGLSIIGLTALIAYLGEWLMTLSHRERYFRHVSLSGEAVTV